jgi:prepilin-type N-terminal cleavage/methylation domain-containing protein
MAKMPGRKFRIAPCRALAYLNPSFSEAALQSIADQKTSNPLHHTVMKSLSFRQPRGFTLVELLVVIAIVAVLATAGFGAANAAIQRARKTTSLAVATALESAVNNFQNDYGTYPIPSAGNTAGSGDATTVLRTDRDVEFLEILLGMNTTENPRGIRYLNVKEGEARKNGIIYVGNMSNVQGLFDPWGGAYFVAMNLNMDDKVEVSPTAVGGQQSKRILNGRNVAVWSNGADGVNGGGKPTDDVKTWR